MQVFERIIPLYQQYPNLSVVLGNFDGVHRGHQELIRRSVERARAEKGWVAVLTFDPHPAQVLGTNNVQLLTTKRQKEMLIGRWGVDLLVYCPFTPSFAHLEAGQFIQEVLWNNFRPQAVFVGFNFTFGRGARGKADLLRAYGQQLGFEVVVVPPVVVDGQVVSSSAIRAALKEGDVRRASLLLGYWPMLEGVVVCGDGRGKHIGFPTANIKLPPEINVPASGVYAVEVQIRGGRYYGVANIGRRPTFGDNLPITVEVYIFDFGADLYGEILTIFLRERLRPEKRFSSAIELAEQIRNDLNQARSALGLS